MAGWSWLGARNSFYHDDEIRFDLIYMVYGVLPASDIEIEYKLFAKNQPVSTKGHLHIKVFEVS